MPKTTGQVQARDFSHELLTQNIIAVVFDVESEGYQAITEVRHAPVSEKYTVLQMALVKREGDTINYCDGFDAGIAVDNGAAMGGLMGSHVGMFGGPLGVLLMGSYGALAGTVAGSAASLDNSLLVEMVASKFTDGDVALIILADEEDEAELDAKFAKFKATIMRCDAARVPDEVDEAIKMQREKERLELIDLENARQKARKAEIDEKRAKLEADFSAFRSKIGFNTID